MYQDGLCQQTVTHPNSNQARCRATLMINITWWHDKTLSFVCYRARPLHMQNKLIKQFTQISCDLQYLQFKVIQRQYGKLGNY